MAKKGRSKRAAVLSMVTSVTGIGGGGKSSQPARSGPSDDEMVARYFLPDTKPCTYTTHRNGNCATRPRCYRGLGEYSVGLWTMTKGFGHDPEEDIREEGGFVGLRNLGATCYMNSLLQCLFMNLTFRRGIYEWRAPKGKEGEPSVVAELQRLFAALQLGQRSSFSPKALTELLQIRTSVQQDAQEFNNLFVGLLEEKLKECENARLRSLVPQQFQGSSAYQTVCEKCRSVSSSDSTFHELVLSIQDSKTLESALKTYLKKEELRGDNQYNCAKCGLADASRRTLLTRLPEVLNFQLLRFAYTDHGKVKVQTETSFPRTLDMAPFVAEGEEKLEYELSAVLLHIGTSAHGGHYVAHIRDEESSQWYKFNDSRVSPLDTKEVGDECISEVPQKDQLSKAKNMVSSVVKQARKRLSSKNAYMLVYTRKDRAIGGSPDPPQHIVDIMQAENAAFFDEIAAYSKARSKAKAVVAEHEAYYERMIKKFLPSSKEDIYWIATSWLRKWVTGEEVPPIDNSQLLCPHDGLDPRATRGMKQISKAAWEELLERYKGGPEAPQCAACLPCVITLYDEQLTKRHNRAARDRTMQLIARGSREGYHVCRAWVAAWRRATTEEEQLALSPNINEHIVCEHGGLCYRTSARRVIPQEAWDYLRNTYPEGPEFPTSVDACPICREAAEEEQREISERRKARAAERRSLDSMVLFKLQSIKSHPPSGTYFLVNQLWFSAWKQYISDPHISPPDAIDNTTLLCEHGMLNFDPSALSPSTIAGERRLQRPFVFITEVQWPVLQELYGGGPAITFTVEEENGKEEKEKEKDKKKEKGKKEKEKEEEEEVEHHDAEGVLNERFSTEPGICVACKVRRDEIIHQQNLNYEDEWVVVLVPSTATGARRAVSYTLRSLTGPKQIRVRVSCTDKVMRIKLQLLEKLNFSPVDQRIFLDDQQLKEDLTMAEQGVLPGSVLRLEVAEQNDDVYDSGGERPAEEGFVGSMLSGRPVPEAGPKEWVCGACTLSNSPDAKGCAACGALSAAGGGCSNGAASASAPAAPAREPSPPANACPVCTFENSPKAVICSMCNSSLTKKRRS